MPLKLAWVSRAKSPPGYARHRRHCGVEFEWRIGAAARGPGEFERRARRPPPPAARAVDGELARLAAAPAPTGTSGDDRVAPCDLVLAVSAGDAAASSAPWAPSPGAWRRAGRPAGRRRPRRRDVTAAEASPLISGLRPRVRLTAASNQRGVTRTGGGERRIAPGRGAGRGVRRLAGAGRRYGPPDPGRPGVAVRESPPPVVGDPMSRLRRGRRARRAHAPGLPSRLYTRSCRWRGRDPAQVTSTP